MEPEVVAEHEEQAQDEGEVVAGQGRQDVPFKEKLNHRINEEGTTMWWTVCGRTRRG